MVQEYVPPAAKDPVSRFFPIMHKYEIMNMQFLNSIAKPGIKIV